LVNAKLATQLKSKNTSKIWNNECNTHCQKYKYWRSSSSNNIPVYTIYTCAYLFINNSPIRKQTVYKFKASSVERQSTCLNKICHLWRKMCQKHSMQSKVLSS